MIDAPGLNRVCWNPGEGISVTVCVARRGETGAGPPRAKVPEGPLGCVILGGKEPWLPGKATVEPRSSSNCLMGKKEKARLAQSGESAPPLSTGTATNDKPIQEDDVADDDEDDKKDGTPQPMNCYFCSRTLPANRLDGRQEEVGRERQIERHGRDPGK